MDKKAKTRKQTIKQITKSIRLTSSKAEELGALVEGTAYAEAQLPRQWVLDGMQQFKVREPIRAYQEGQVNLHGGAEHAKLPMALLFQEMASLKVAVLSHADVFGPGLDNLRAGFDAPKNSET